MMLILKDLISFKKSNLTNQILKEFGLSLISHLVRLLDRLLLGLNSKVMKNLKN